MKKTAALFFLAFLALTSPVFGTGITYGPEKVFESPDAYTAFGNTFPYNATYSGLTYRYASIHGTGQPSEVRFRKFNNVTRVWDASDVVVYDNASIDAGDPIGVTINGDIFIFFVKRSLAGGYGDIVYMKSTDGGDTWGSETVVTTFTGTGGRKGHVHGKVAHLSNGDWMLGYYSHDGSQTAGTWEVGVIVSSDDGATWTADKDLIYSPAHGTASFGEISIESAGSNRVIALIRDQTGGAMGQATSTDNGLTWTDPDVDRVNIGTSSGGVKVPYVEYEENTNQLIAFFEDRNSSANRVQINLGDADDVFADPDNWDTDFITVDSLFANGYTSFAKIDADKYVGVYYREDVIPNTSSSRNTDDSDAWYIIYQLDQSEPVVMTISGLDISGLDVR